MEPEYGFKQKGPEPTRYGDWENKGKCVDFWIIVIYCILCWTPD